MGFILADAGYDVWMVNTRGNKYSTNHTKLDPANDWEYWDHASAVEAAKYDLPCFIDYILEKTNLNSLTVLAHSLGTQSLFYGLANPTLAPFYSSKINLAITLAPTMYVTDTTFLINTVMVQSVAKLSEFRK